MNGNFYFTTQVFLAGLAMGVFFLQLLIFWKERREKAHLWCMVIALHGFIFCMCEAAISRHLQPLWGPIMTKIQHTSLSIYPFSFIFFWRTLLKDRFLSKVSLGVLATGMACVAAIWLTPYHLGGAFTYREINPGSAFVIGQWDFTDKGPFSVLEITLMFGTITFLPVYLLQRPRETLKYIDRSLWLFIGGTVFLFICILNDVAVWFGAYRMYYVSNLGNFVCLLSLTGLLSHRELRMYEETRMLNVKLEETVAERTRELSDLNRRLEEIVEQRTDELMQKEAEIAHKSKMESLGLLASGITHDMNNILMSISGNLQLIKTEELSSGAEKKIANALESCFHAKRCVEQLGTFSQQRNDKLHLEDFSRIVNLALTIFKGSSHFIKIKMEEPDEPVFAYIESSSILSLLLNIFINSRDAMQGKGELTIRYRKETIPNARIHRPVPRREYLHVSISDTGTGIPESIIDKVWNPFFTTKRPGRGTGLGLAAARDIINRHGGDIWFTSRRGEGTTFHILLRTGIPGVTGEYLPVEQELPEDLSIMLVEDRKDPQEIIAGFLKEFGYAPAAFSESRHALLHFREHPSSYDLLLTDYALPEMNGLELAREFKTIKPEMPVILFSGNLQAAPESSYIEAFLKKPFSPAELRYTLIEVVTKGRLN